jgi:N-acetylneuraminic acid mutarotase
MVLWGGNGRDIYNTGGRYDPATDTWTPTATAAAPSARYKHTAVWTGDVMVVWGGEEIVSGSEHYLDSGGRYDPTADSWTPMSSANAPSARIDHTAVWTGSVMVVWGSSGDSTGGRYNPTTDSWASTSTTAAPSARSLHTALWTGDRVVVWGGRGLSAEQLNTGGRYDPATDTWTPTTLTAAPSARDRHTAVWTGSRMVVWGGFAGESGLDTGGRYDPVGDSWTPTSTTGAPAARYDHVAVGTANLVVVWGGGDFGSPMDTGGRYNPVADSWTPMSTIAAPTARAGHTAVWTGSELIVWGGNDISSGNIFNTGGVYGLAPTVDNDSDGTTVCQGDCDDANSSIHPGAPELCDGLDNNCSGQVDEDANGLDNDEDGVRNACDNCVFDANAAQSDFDHDNQGDLCDLDDGLIYVFFAERDYREWQSEAGYTNWNSYRGSLSVLRATGQYTQVPGSNPLAGRDCGVSTTAVFDPLVPSPGEVSFTLVTGVLGAVESSLGTDSAGIPRVNAHPCP